MWYLNLWLKDLGLVSLNMCCFKLGLHKKELQLYQEPITEYTSWEGGKDIYIAAGNLQLHVLLLSSM